MEHIPKVEDTKTDSPNEDNIASSEEAIFDENRNDHQHLSGQETGPDIHQKPSESLVIPRNQNVEQFTEFKLPITPTSKLSLHTIPESSPLSSPPRSSQVELPSPAYHSTPSKEQVLLDESTPTKESSRVEEHTPISENPPKVQEEPLRKRKRGNNNIAIFKDFDPPYEAASEQEKADWDGFCEIESDPSIFNLMLNDFGVRGVKVQEVFGLDEEMLMFLP
jgi:hypothetical protein